MLVFLFVLSGLLMIAETSAISIKLLENVTEFEVVKVVKKCGKIVIVQIAMKIDFWNVL